MSGFHNVVRWLRTRSSGRSSKGRRRTLDQSDIETSISSTASACPGSDIDFKQPLKRMTGVRRSLPPIPKLDRSRAKDKQSSVNSSRSCSMDSDSVYDEIPAWAISDHPGQRTCIALSDDEDPFVAEPIPLDPKSTPKSSSVKDIDSADECFEYDIETSSQSDSVRKLRKNVSRSNSNSSSNASSDAGICCDSAPPEVSDIVITNRPPLPPRKKISTTSNTSNVKSTLSPSKEYLLSTVSSELKENLTFNMDTSVSDCFNLTFDSTPRKPTLGVSAMCLQKQKRRSIDVVPPSLEEFRRNNIPATTTTPRRKLSLPPTPSRAMPANSAQRKPNRLLNDLMRVNRDKMDMMI